MPTLWFCVPAHGRLRLTAICLRQLRRTCDALLEHGIEATAVVVADDDNLRIARQLGFGTIRRDNFFLSRRFNDAFSLALDPQYNPRPADYVVPIGSDDFVDHRILIDLPGPKVMVGFQRMSFVREDGMEITTTQLTNSGGAGIRIYPRQLLKPFGYRPADEDRRRGCDTSIITSLQKHWGVRMGIEHRHLHDRQIVDFKTTGAQLNTYSDLARWRRTGHADPFQELAGIYPDEALEEMRRHYGRTRIKVAA